MATVLAPRSEERTFKRWNYTVSGWFSSPHELEERPGVFVIATEDFKLPFVLDVSESDNVKFCVLNHPRRTLWRRNALGGILYAAIYTEDGESPFLSGFQRKNIEQHIRNFEQPVFGSDDLFSGPAL
ncbi:MAG TPA: hypothetical protein VFT64_05235 [Rickettsiales bacterium]|nr:hypothetical protein [Rickettsiales bacterium]